MMLTNSKTENTIVDLTSQHETIVSQEETHMVTLLENVQIVLFRFRLEPQPGFDYISPSISQLTGFSNKEYYTNPQLFLQTTFPEDRPLLGELLAGKVTFRNPIVVRTYRNDGEIAWLEYVVAPVQDLNNHSVAIEGMIRNVTREWQIELALQESQAQLSSIIDSAMDAIIVLNPDQNIIIFNKAAEEMFGYPASQVLGQTLDRLIPVPARTYHRAQMEEFGKTNLSGYRMGETRVTTGIRADGSSFPLEASISVFLAGTRRFYTAIVRDITERKQSEAQLVHLSTHDPLTGLYNRAFFEAEISRLEQRRPSPLTVVIADVDALKYVNDVFGHASGDELLRDVAKIFKTSFRAEDVVARLGGDEFGVILPHADAHSTTATIQRIRTRIMANNRLNRKLPISLSIGIATAESSETLADTIKRADTLMYEEKRTKGAIRNDLSI